MEEGDEDVSCPTSVRGRKHPAISNKDVLDPIIKRLIFEIIKIYFENMEFCSIQSNTFHAGVMEYPGVPLHAFSYARFSYYGVVCGFRLKIKAPLASDIRTTFWGAEIVFLPVLLLLTNSTPGISFSLVITYGLSALTPKLLG